MTSSKELRLRVNAVLADTRALATAAGVGVMAADAVVDEFVAGLSRDAANFSVVDTRAADKDASRRSISDALKSDKPIVVVLSASTTTTTTTPPLPALTFLQSLAEKKTTADLGDLITRPIKAGTSAVVVVVGADEFAGLPRQLQRIDFWEFLA